jgi:hypothetical protein
MQAEVWMSRDGVALGDELVGYGVEGRDGEIGKIDHVAYEKTFVIVSTSRLFGRKFVIPASFVERVDTDGETTFVDLSKEEVENSPAYDDDVADDDWEVATGAYYAEVLANRAPAR